MLVDIDVSDGANAIDYTSLKCPMLAFNCVRSQGEGEVKITPRNSTILKIDTLIGQGCRFRIKTDSLGCITKVEIASPGEGYPEEVLRLKIDDPYGEEGAVDVIIKEGKAVETVIISGGRGYTGYVSFNVDDFIEGVTYNIAPRHIEQVSGDGVLRLVGYLSRSFSGHV